VSVYYIHSPDTGLLKIGHAQNPPSRLVKMQVDSPTRLVMLAIEPGGNAVERERHQQFAHLRTRGEWFRFEPELKALVESLPQYTPLVKSWRALPGPLGEWIRRNNHTLESFATATGTTSATISRVCAGKQFPGRAIMLRIIEATNWEVDANALLGITPSPASEAA
jgi:hypothetical protein